MIYKCTCTNVTVNVQCTCTYIVYSIQWEKKGGLWCLMPFSTIFQLILLISYIGILRVNLNDILVDNYVYIFSRSRGTLYILNTNKDVNITTYSC
jgi:hypothetical protein